MSSTATTDIVLVTMQNSAGTSDTAEIRIDISSLAAVATSSAFTTMILVTYDSSNQAFVTAGPFTQTLSVQQTTAWGTPQTAILLVAENPIPGELVLQFAPAVAAPVKWRAVGLVADGGVPDTETLAIGYSAGPIALPDASTDLDDEASVYFGFFASAMTMPTMSNPTRIVLRAETLDSVTGPPPLDHRIQCFNWNQLGGTANGAGPWFYTYVKVVWRTTDFRPPPTDSDDFWAPPAGCDESDVFLINNNALAPYWDIPEMKVADEPDTLLLNYTEPDGTRWMLNDLDGWWTLPPPALPDLPRPGYLDGSFPVDGRYEPRIITLTGTFWPGTGESVAVPRLRLLRSLDAVRNGALLVVKEPEWPKQALVWLSDQPKVTTDDLSGKTSFEVQLKAVDPIKYHSGTMGLGKALLPWAGAADGRTYSTVDPVTGQRFVPTDYRRYADTQASTSAEVVNQGTANIWPRIFLYGPMLNPVVINEDSEQTMVFQGAIQPGEVLVVDCYWRTVVLRLASEVSIDDGFQADINGVNRRWMLRLSSPWIYMEPGTNRMYYKANDVDLPTTPAPGDPIPSDKTQCWVVYRSGWAGS